MGWLIAAASAGAVVVVIVLYPVVKDRGRRPGRVLRRLAVTAAALALTAWGLMLLPPVNDAVLGDLPRDLADFARICGKDGKGGGEPFPRAAPYQPGAGPHPWVAIEDGTARHSSTGTETEEPDRARRPDPDTVELVVCGEVVGTVPDTAITCHYSPVRTAPATQSVDFAQGLYAVTVHEARTGDTVGDGTLKGDDEVECSEVVVAGDPGPHYTTPGWDAYADLLARIHPAPSGS